MECMRSNLQLTQKLLFLGCLVALLVESVAHVTITLLQQPDVTPFYSLTYNCTFQIKEKMTPPKITLENTPFLHFLMGSCCDSQ